MQECYLRNPARGSFFFSILPKYATNTLKTPYKLSTIWQHKPAACSSMPACSPCPSPTKTPFCGLATLVNTTKTTAAHPRPDPRRDRRPLRLGCDLHLASKPLAIVARAAGPPVSRLPASGPPAVPLPAGRQARTRLPAVRASLPARTAPRLPAGAANSPAARPAYDWRDPVPPPQFPPRTPPSRLRRSRPRSGPGVTHPL